MTQEEFDEWRKLTSWLATAKKREMELRKMIASDKVEDTELGTNHVTIFDTAIKVVIKETLTLDQGKSDELALNMSEAELDCLEHKVALNKKKYDKLPADNYLALNCVTRKPASPTITLE